MNETLRNRNTIYILFVFMHDMIPSTILLEDARYLSSFFILILISPLLLLNVYVYI